jgi:hypothetical protein
LYTEGMAASALEKRTLRTLRRWSYERGKGEYWVSSLLFALANREVTRFTLPRFTQVHQRILHLVEGNSDLFTMRTYGFNANSQGRTEHTRPRCYGGWLLHFGRPYTEGLVAQFGEGPAAFLVLAANYPTLPAPNFHARDEYSGLKQVRYAASTEPQLQG